MKPCRPTNTPARRAGGRTRRLGSVLIYSVFALLALLAIASLAIDLGRVQLTKTELQRATDAAARAAAAYLPNDTAGARAAAIAVAGYNLVDGTPLVLQSSDVVFGKWNAATGVLDTSSATPDTCRVTAQRSDARGNAVQLSCGQVIGFDTCDVRATATAQASVTATYRVLGVSSFSMATGAFTSTYDSTAGTFTTGAASDDASIASNGTVTLGANSSVGGTVYYNTASAPSGGVNYDAKTKMSAAAAVPTTPTLGSYASSNSNPSIGMPTSGASASYSSSGTMPIAAGTYVFATFTLGGSVTMQFSGPTVIYVTGSANMTGSAQLRPYQNKPSNLTIRLCSGAALNLDTSAEMWAVIDAPAGNVTLSNSARIVGAVVGNNVTLNGTSSICFDKQLGTNGAGAGGGGTAMVR